MDKRAGIYLEQEFNITRIMFVNIDIFYFEIL